MLEYSQTHHKLPQDLPGDLIIQIYFTDNEPLNPEEREYLEIKTENYISKVAKYGIQMNYDINQVLKVCEIEFIVTYKVYTSNFFNLYCSALDQLKKTIEKTYFPYYLKLRNDFKTTKK